MMYEKKLKEDLEAAIVAVDNQEKLVYSMSTLDADFIDEYSKLNNLRTNLETAKSRIKNRKVRNDMYFQEVFFANH